MVRTEGDILKKKPRPQGSGPLWSIIFALPSPAGKSIGSDMPHWQGLKYARPGVCSGLRLSPGPLLALPSSLPPLLGSALSSHGCTSPHPPCTPGASPIGKCSDGQSPPIRLQIPKRDSGGITPSLGSSPHPAGSFFIKGAAFPQTPAARQQDKSLGARSHPRNAESHQPQP